MDHDFPFQVTEHVIDSAHIRQRRGAVSCDAESLKLSVKQYVPLANLEPKPGDVTIIAGNSNIAVKEMFEPFFASILKHHLEGETSRTQAGPDHHSLSSGLANGSDSNTTRPRIRGIWIADFTHHGHSYILNEHNIGNAPHYFDHSRDLFLLTNMFRHAMPPPIVGISQSLSTCQFAFLSYFHPSLFQALVFVEPVIWHGPAPGAYAYLNHAAKKKDVWPSRQAAEEALRASRHYRTWDEQVLSRLFKYGLRDLPTLLHPYESTGAAAGRAGERGVTLTTTKHQEVFMGFQGQSKVAVRPETAEAFRLLPYLAPPVLYVSGVKSTFTSAQARHERLHRTGTGEGGSGGLAAGMVEETILNGGHLLPFENVDELGKAVAPFIDAKVRAWGRGMRQWKMQWLKKTALGRQTVDSKYVDFLSKPRHRDSRL